jgi:hypothetical protein
VRVASTKNTPIVFRWTPPNLSCQRPETLSDWSYAAPVICQANRARLMGDERKTVELSDSNVIAALTRRPEDRIRTRRVKPVGAGVEKRAPKVRLCKCGTCWTCAENARWSRIFAEKFEDPDYYQTKPVAFQSPLARM